MRIASLALGALLGLSVSVSANPAKQPLNEKPAARPPAIQGISPAGLREDGVRAARPALEKVRSGRRTTEGETLLGGRRQLADSLTRAFSRREAQAVTAQAFSREQRQALADFSARHARSAVEIRLSAESGKPTFLRSGTVPLATTTGNDHESRKQTALGFLDNNAMMFGLKDPAASLALKQSRSDALGQHHYRFQQHVNGVPVYGAEVLAHFNARGELHAMTTRVKPGLHVDTAPSISMQDAKTLVQERMTVPVDVRKNELQVRDIAGRYRLVYDVESYENTVNRWRTVVDAHSGRILTHFLDRHEADVAASGKDLAGSVHSFRAWQQAGLYYMLDVTTPVLVGDEDPLFEESGYGDTYVLDFVGSEGEAIEYVTSSGSTAGWDTTAVSALRNGQKAFDYFKNHHGRDGIDGANGNLRFGIHFGQEMDNAFWSGGWMIFGDGGYAFDDLAACLDVVGHEMSHGVIEHTAGLIYENQSGALNESIADFFGAMVDRGDWLMGEDCTVIDPGYLRNLRDPHKGLSSQPAHMDEFEYMPNTPDTDHGGVHVNSGIPNRAAYLIVEGLTEEGIGTSIGYEKAERIYYRALSTYMVASSQFIDLRRALLLAAEDLYPGQATVTGAVNAAFDAVGIVEGNTGTPDDSEPTEAEAAAGDDLAIYLYPFDGTYDGSESGFDVYYQALDNPFTGYDISNDYGPLNDFTAAQTRPAAFTADYGTVFIYVGADSNAYWVDNYGDFALTDDGSVWSISSSDDGKRLAYTANDAFDNNIYVIDVEAGTTEAFPLTVADYQPEGGVTGTRIFYADALDFDYTGDRIVFDALVCVPTANLECDPANPYGYWTIGILNIANGAIHYPFRMQNPDFDIGYPTFAKNNNHIIAFDYVEYLDNGNFDTATYTFNVEKNEYPGNGVYRGEHIGGPELWGVPGFWGDDDALTFQALINDYRRISTVRIELNSDFSIDFATPSSYMNDYDAAFAEMHRAAYRDLSANTLTPSSSLVDFGDVDAGSSKTSSLTLSNNSSSDITIYQVQSSSGDFLHGFSNTRVPRGQSLTGKVTFSGSSTEGTKNGTLSFFMDTSDEPLEVDLTATITAESDDTDDGASDDDSDDGGSDDDSGNGDGGGGSGGGGALLWLLAGLASIRLRQLTLN